MQTPLDFSAFIAERTRDFTGREWVFAAINEWLTKPDGPRSFLLTGEPGCGKTAIAGRLCQFSKGEVPPPDEMTFLTRGFLGAWHFCATRDRRWINPQSFAESVALQLKDRYPEYAKALAEKSGDRQVRIELNQQATDLSGRMTGLIIKSLDLGGVSPEDAFMRVVREPLEAIYAGGFKAPVVILVDALDEALSYTGSLNILSLLADDEHLPTRVRFILTSRPNDALRSIRRNNPQECDLTSGGRLVQSLNDVTTHVMRVLKEQPQLAEKVSQDLAVEAFATAMRDKSAGNFLYVYHMLQMLTEQQGEITRQTLDELPTGLDGVYTEFLDRLTGGK
jgi:AAA ATPase domain